MTFFNFLYKIVARKLIAASVGAVIAVGIIGYGGFAIGQRYPTNIVVRGVTNIENDPMVTADFGVYWQAWKMLKDDYLKGAELKEKSLVYGSIDGLVRSLEDPNTVFFPPEEGKKFEQDVKGSFGGIGAEIGIKNDQLVIIAPLKDSPAERAGLRAADKILKIGDKITTDIKVNDAVTLIRGEIGTEVKLLILRNGWEKPKDFLIARQVIQVPTLESKMLENDIAYVRLRSFNENAPRLFYEAARDFLNKGINGVILDLRDDPGGFLEVAVNLAGWFMEKGSVVAIEEFRGSEQEIFRSYGDGLLKPVPVVVLVNQGSASASEILAGALRDNRGAALVGEKTFGKGTVQELKRLKDNSSIKLTIAHWLLPKGDMIDKNGIMPTYEVKITEEDVKAGRDSQLEKAKAVMADLIKKIVIRQ